MLTRFGNITFQVPQVRSGNFYPSALEKGTRTEQAVNLALAEMYVQGVSTRRVIEVLQKLVGPDLPLSHTQVSRAAAKLDEGLKAWRERPLKRGTLSVSGCDLPQGASGLGDPVIVFVQKVAKSLNAFFKWFSLRAFSPSNLVQRKAWN